ncbi:sigma-54-dependent transcriptional regulator [Chelatococcus composti]|jgi:Response regulator containing CheY-like receiver, AAA-type ATPase, and DNA-binding domains|uniref:Two-component system C4-dicarboxylate transport response regulator DctD n=1 Tax=Chelatococcus composti TaxID=1743235 RepID=A0A841K2E4_9HYPH|nr:sigma-54 dependent transcriptional regulator [Chelatococcus composti]MBB6166908.1 two-component system C4-dicarboxylate transport response regulator DctD [Chelatococcus composti]MBS7734168.1 sigma-54-dependent Fis family transcriptional regulator [Chelatococcus composti]GGG24912.1 Fis family transcriptional regulator [Chelatococcus composti]
MKQPCVLLIDDEEDILRSIRQALELAGFKVRELTSADAALDLVTPGFPGIIVSDIRMPGMDGMTLLTRVRDIDADVPVILVTGHGDVQLAVRAMREGAYDFIEKPFSAQHLADVVARALDRRSLVLENRLLRAAAGKRDDLETRLPGRSQAMIDLRHRLRAVAGTDADVLIVGETGVGKEVVARALHDNSGRADRPFVVINCAALPANLIESELFGHEAGAFPGAIRARYGKFEHARGGTILLDEIGQMPLDLQARLLRVIEDRVIVRLGSNEPIPLDIRFIATSKVELEEEVAAGRFRADLLYRLNVVTLRVPPLAARREDVPILFLQLLREAAGRYRREPVDPPPHVIEAIARRDWPGNVRELRNAADRYVLGLGVDGLDAAAEEQTGLTLAERMARYEKSIIASALQAHGGALKPVYEELGISRKTLYEKMQRYRLGRRDAAE